MRVGGKDDVAAAVSVWQSGERLRSQPPGPARTTRVRTALRSPASLLLVAGEPVAAMLLVELLDRRLEVTMLCVAPQHRSTGAARALVAAVRARFPVVHGWSTEPDCCEALGFVRTGRQRDGAVEVVSDQ